MTEEKSWYHSTTIWGSLISVAAALGATFGISVDGDSQAAISEAIVQMVGAFGALIAIYGRLSATEMIS